MSWRPVGKSDLASRGRAVKDADLSPPDDEDAIVVLKGKTISVPFASTSHGMLLRAIEAQGWNPETDVNIITQAPEVAGPALQTNKIEAHADFVPFAELFPWRGFARKIFDGSQANTPTLHGALVDGDYAEKYPEIVVAYLRAALEADRLIAEEPETYSELIAKVTGIEAEVVYLFHGPLGLQTRDVTWKPEYRQAVATSIKTLKLLKRTDSDLDINHFVTEKYIRAALSQIGRDYDADLKNYDQLPLYAKDAATGEPIEDFSRVAQIWVKDEPKVRHYASPESALKALARLEKDGRAVRVVYAQDRESGIKLFANQAWFVRSERGELGAFLLKDGATRWANIHGGEVLDYAGARESLVAGR
ncbi:NitT/TauT family transport system substrate-binding protein [Bradyrhizobium sp. Gha]|nr:NitT/TauT family transport system substrate-binding protein [Bradyrhizobium sp. Gha]